MSTAGQRKDEIDFFLEEPPAAAEYWATAANLIVSQIVQPDHSIHQIAPQTLAQIPRSASLDLAIKSGEVNGTDTENVKAHLEDNVVWRASFLNRAACEEPSTWDGLDVSVVGQEVVESTQIDPFYSYGKYNGHSELFHRREDKAVGTKAVGNTDRATSGRGGKPGSNNNRKDPESCLLVAPVRRRDARRATGESGHCSG